MLFVCATPLLAADRCGVPEQVNDLIDTVSRQSAQDGVLSTQALRRLRIELGRAEHVVTAREGDVGLGQWKPAFDWMLVASREAARTGRFSDPGTLRARVGALIVGMRFSCMSAASSGDGEAAHDQSDGAIIDHIEKMLGRRISDLSVLERSFLGLLVVLVVAPFAIGVIWIAQQGVAWFRTSAARPAAPPQVPRATAAPSKIYNQHVCRIHAALEIGLDVVDVDIVALDEIGGQIRPVNTGAYQRTMTLIQEQAQSDPGQLIIGPHRIAFQILNTHQGLIDGFFCPPIEQQLLEALLNASVIPPEFTPLPKTKAAPA